jgi:hypothetical protein
MSVNVSEQVQADGRAFSPIQRSEQTPACSRASAGGFRADRLGLQDQGESARFALLAYYVGLRSYQGLTCSIEASVC